MHRKQTQAATPKTKIAKPVQNRLLVPLTCVLLVLIAGFGYILINQQRRNLNEVSLATMNSATDHMKRILDQQSQAIASLEQVLVMDEDLIDALKSRDRQRLLRDFEQIFIQLRERYGVTHFYFHLPDRVNLLRVHKPEKNGDLIERYTAIEAERTGRPAAGIELGPLGTFTLRVVRPVRAGNSLVGYLELGKEIEDILFDIKIEHTIELVVAIQKTHINRANWEAGMQMLGRKTEWDRLPGDVLIYSSIEPPPEFENIIDEKRHTHNALITKKDFNGKSWHVMVHPLEDVSGTEVGDLVLLADISRNKVLQARYIAMISAGVVTVLSILFVFLFSVLRQTDRRILGQQAKLKDSETRLDLAMSVANDGVWDWNLKDNTVLFDDRYYTMAGYDPGEFPMNFEAWEQRVHPDDLEQTKKVLELYMDGSTARYEAEFRFRHKAGQYIWIRAKGEIVAYDDNGNPTRIVGTHTDITDRKQAEIQLLESEKKFRGIFESFQDLYFKTDTEGVFELLSPSVKHLSGYDEDDLIGKSVLETFAHSADRDELMKALLADGKVSDFELELKKKDKEITTVSLNAQIVADAAGRFKGVEGVMRDITEKKRKEKELRSLNEVLEEAIARANAMAVEAEMANTAKSEFLANMSHEIRTPMNGVIGMTDLLLDTALTREQRKFAGIVRASAEALLTLINDILDFSKIEAGKLDLEILDFDLRTTLEDMSDVVAVKAHEKGLELTVLVDTEVPSLLKGDPGRLRQIVVNLVGNAVKFTDAGEVSVRADLEEESETEALIRFSVTDTGIGIPPDQQEALFSPFTQADGSTTRKFGGTGLGLSISKQLTEMMGGEIGVESVDNEGSTFWFTARFEKQSGSAGPSLETAVEIRGVRVLVVDDYETNRLLVTTLLHSWGCRCEEAADGATALRKFQKEARAGDPFRAALIDMQMPGMDGEDLGRRIKADPQTRETVLIMMTSMGQRGDAKRLEAAGFAAYLSKPVHQGFLHDSLAMALGAKQSGKEESGGATLITRHTLTEVKNRSARILLTEDNLTNQQVALAILGKLGYQTDVAHNGKEALKTLETQPYDLVLMDCQMPEMDGYEATRQIRERERQAGGDAQPATRTPIIAMTAHAMQGDREKCLKAGMDDYIAKPINPRIIAETLERWLADQDTAGGLQNGQPVQAAPPGDDSETDDQILAVFDREALLNRLMGDEDLAASVLTGFLSDMPGQIDALTELVEQGNVEHAGAQAHKIKGAAANIGGEALRRAAYEIEQACKNGDLDVVRSKTLELETQFGRLKSAMEKDAALN